MGASEGYGWVSQGFREAWSGEGLKQRVMDLSRRGLEGYGLRWEGPQRGRDESHKGLGLKWDDLLGLAMGRVRF